MNQTTLVSGGVHGWNAAGLVRVCRALTAPLYRGPKARHKPAQGKRGTSAALGFAFKKRQSPERARQHVCRPFRALFISCTDPRAASASDAALPWAGLCRAFGPEFAASAKVNDRLWRDAWGLETTE